MDKAIEVAREDFATIRTGRANPALFNKIVVEYYGSYTPGRHVRVRSARPRRVGVPARDEKSAVGASGRGWRGAGGGVSPARGGWGVGVRLPAWWEERGKELGTLDRRAHV